MSMLTLDVNHFYSIGHRGTEVGAVENTISAIRYAAKLQLDFAEIDIQTSKDGVLFVFHDDQLNNKTSLKGVIADYHSEQLKETVITTHQGSDKIPKLSQVFDILHEDSTKNLNLIIEIKAPIIYSHLLDQIYKNNMQDRVVLDSFSLARLTNLKKMNGNIPISWLISRKKLLFYNWKKILEKVKKEQFIGASFHQIYLKEHIIEEFHRQGKLIFAWGVKNKKDYERLLNLHINGFTAPDPGYLMNILNDRGN